MHLPGTIARASSSFTLVLLLGASGAYYTVGQTNTFPSSGNAGVGTTSPSNPLVVVGGANSYSSVVQNPAAAGSSFGLLIDAGGNSSDFSFRIRQRTGAAELFAVRGDGYVGIGTTSPDSPLHVLNGPAMTSGWNRSFNLQATYPVAVFNSAATKWAGIGYDYSAAMRFWVNATSNDVSGTGLNALTILNGGNVGIGTGNPGERLTVQSTMGFRSSANSTRMTITGSESENSINTSGGVPLGVYISGTNYFRVNTNGSNRFVITGSGTVGIGTDSPAYKLDVNGEINATGLRINGTPISSGAGSQWANGSGGAISYSSGNVGIGTASPIAKLDIAGAIRANNHLTLLPWYNLGTAPAGAWVHGYMKLVTPIVHNEENMFSIKIKGYRYGTGGTPLEIRCGGYAYGTTTLISAKCDTEGTADKVGIGVEGTNVIITIGSLSGGPWYYDHFTAEYSGWTAKNPDGFVWQFVPNADPTTTNTNNVVVDDSAGTITTTGNVGIGTTSPGEPLTVQSTIGLRSSANSTRMTISGSESENTISTSGGVPLGVYISGTNYFKVNTNGVNRLLINGSGKVGIGKDPIYDLDVNGEINATGLRINGTPSVSSQWGGSSSIYYTGGNVGIGTTSPQRTLDLGTNGQLTFGNDGYTSSGSPGLFWYGNNTLYGIYKSAGAWAAPNFQQLNLNFPTGIVIDGGSGYGRSGTVLQPDAGNVGIGTTTPAAKLDVNGVIRSSATNGFSIGNDQGQNRVQRSGTTFQFLTSTSEAAPAQVGGLAITSSYSNNAPGYGLYVEGKVGIGLTDPGTYKLNVNGEINATGLSINGTPISTGASSQWTNGSGSISYNDGKVGIGVAEPLARLDVNGAIRANNHLTLLPWYNLGTPATQAWAHGYMKLVTPIVHNEENMFSIKIKGYRYGTGGTPLEIRCGGYAYGTTGLTSAKCDTEGTADKVGIGVEGTNVIITIGSQSGGPWYYDHFTAEYSGWTAKNPDGFVWQFVPDADPTTTNTNNVVVDDSAGTITTTGNVGIGTTSPGEPLTVQSTIGLRSSANSTRMTITGGESENAISTSGGVPLGVYISGTNYFKVNTNGVNRLLVTGAGKVGIGKDPTYDLDVNGEINASGLRINGTPIPTVNSQWTNGSGAISYNDGNVGIGTTSPAALLDLKTASNSHLGIRNVSGTPQLLGMTDNAGSYAGLYIDGTNLMLNSFAGGNVGIGVSGAPTEKLEVNGNIKLTGTINAKYQDVAEWVPSSDQLPVGTVVVLDSTKSNQVTSSSISYDTRVAGVISEQPGLALGEKADHKVLVATTGRVKVKVDASKGAIHIGDLLVTSDVPGVAMKSEAVNLGGVQFHRPGTLIGKALEPLEKGKGEILVLLSLQ